MKKKILQVNDIKTHTCNIKISYLKIQKIITYSTHFQVLTRLFFLYNSDTISSLKGLTFDAKTEINSPFSSTRYL